MRAALTAGCDGHARRSEPGLVARAALVVLGGYKLLVSPLFTGSCRFTPSCSTYMTQAIREHGALRGGWLGARRLLRCHPFGGHGFDPVPPPRV
jgi:uncharacterized protein